MGSAEAEAFVELHAEVPEMLMRAPTTGPERGGVHPEQPFIVLGQEEYGEHHSSIMHCRCVSPGGLGFGLLVPGGVELKMIEPLS